MKIGFKPDGGQFVKSQTNSVFVLLSFRIKLNSANRRLDGPKSSQRVFFEIPISSMILRSYWLLGESLLCDYPMVTDYILETNLTKRKQIKNVFIHF